MTFSTSHTIATADMSSPISSPTLRQRHQPARTQQSQPHDEQNECTCDTDAAAARHSAHTPPPSPSLTSTLKACTAQLAYDLLPYDKLPSWLQDNPYIASGYRVEIGWKNSCHSLCHLHNETMNIWTHFMSPVAIMLVLLVVTIWGMSPHGVDRLNLNVVDLGRLRGVQTTQPTELLCPLSPVSTDATLASSIYRLCLRRQLQCRTSRTSPPTTRSCRRSSSSSSRPPPTCPSPSPRCTTASNSTCPTSSTSHAHCGSRPRPSHTTCRRRHRPSSCPSSTAWRSTSSSLHATVTDVVSMESVARLKALMVENVGGFSPYVTMQRHVDMVRVVRAMMAQYVKTLMEEQDAAE